MAYTITVRDAITHLKPGALWVLNDYNKFSSLVWKDTEQTAPTETEVNNYIAQKKNEEAVRLLRTERSARLRQTDWRASSDMVMSDEWKAYRQALRYMTNQTPTLDANGDLDFKSVTWPTLPPSS